MWARDGSRTAATALARDTMTSQRTAGAALHRARELASMPAPAAALAAGRFSTDYVDVLARANRPWRDAVFADHEQRLVDEIAGLRYHQARRVIDYWCQHADADAADDRARRDRDDAHVHASTTIDGQVVIDGVLDPIRGRSSPPSSTASNTTSTWPTSATAWCAPPRNAAPTPSC